MAHSIRKRAEVPSRRTSRGRPPTRPCFRALATLPVFSRRASSCSWFAMTARMAALAAFLKMPQGVWAVGRASSTVVTISARASRYHYLKNGVGIFPASQKGVRGKGGRHPVRIPADLKTGFYCAARTQCGPQAGRQQDGRHPTGPPVGIGGSHAGARRKGFAAAMP